MYIQCGVCKLYIKVYGSAWHPILPIAGVFSPTQPLSGTWSAGQSDNRQLSSQQDEVLLDHHYGHHRQQQQLVGGSSAGVLGQMGSLREKEVVVDEHLEGMVQRRRALEQLEKVRRVLEWGPVSAVCVCKRIYKEREIID